MLQLALGPKSRVARVNTGRVKASSEDRLLKKFIDNIEFQVYVICYTTAANIDSYCFLPTTRDKGPGTYFDFKEPLRFSSTVEFEKNLQRVLSLNLSDLTVCTTNPLTTKPRRMGLYLLPLLCLG